jgi:hypothetical protein
MQRAIFKTLLLALLSLTGSAFVVTPATKPQTLVRLDGSKKIDDNNDASKPLIPTKYSAAAFATMATLSQPLIALAEDDYEYGAVDAPPFVPIIGGILAILTALLPVFLRSGEEAFEEMKGQGEFGEGNDPLKSKKR